MARKSLRQRQRENIEEREKKRDRPLASGDYPGRVKTPFTIGKAAPPGLAGTYESEAEYRIKETEAKKQAQLALLTEQQRQKQANLLVESQQAPAQIPTIQTPTIPTLPEEIPQLIPPEEPLPTIEQIQLEQPPGSRNKEIALEIIEELKRQETEYGGIQGIFPESFRAKLRIAGKSIQETLSKRQLTEIWDTVKKFFTQKKPLKYSNALEGLNARIEIMRMGIADAKAGQPYYDAEKDLRKAVDEFSRMQESVKGLGKENPNWYIDEGASIMAEIDNKLTELNDIREDLEYIKAAQREGDIANLRKAYGL